jgi:hypothetical protein
MMDYASSLQSVSVHSDEAIMAAQTLLVRMGVTQEYMRDATRVTLNWADALGKDLNSAALDIGKAFGGNLMMLQRYGVRVDANTVKTKGFGVVIEELDKKFGGASEALGSTFQGRLKQISNLIGDAKEKIGMAIVGSEGWKKILEVVSKWLAKLNDWLIENRESIIQFGETAAVYTIQFSRAMVVGFLRVQQAGGTTVKTLLDIAKAASYVNFTATGHKWRQEIDKMRTGVVEMGATSMQWADDVNSFTDALLLDIKEAAKAARESTETIAGGFQDIATAGDPAVAKLRDMQQVISMVREDLDAWESIGDRLTRELHLGVENVTVSFKHGNVAMMEFFENLRQSTFQFAESWTSSVIDNILQARKSFGELVADFLKGMAAMIMKMLAFKALRMAFGIPFSGGGYVGYQHGGYVMGAGGIDTIPARLSSGEYVLNRGAVNRIGRDALDRMNYGDTYNSSVNVSVNLNSSGSATMDAYAIKRELENVLPDVFKESRRRNKIK